MLSIYEYTQKIFEAGIKPNQIGRTKSEYKLVRDNINLVFSVENCKFDLGHDIGGKIRDASLERVWIHNPETGVKRFVLSDLEIPDGFIKETGKSSFKGKNHSSEAREKMRKSKLGRIWIHNPTTQEEKFILKDSDIPEGFVKGVSPNRFGSKTTLGMIWVYNPETKERKFISGDSEIPEGFVRGVPKKPKKIKPPSNRYSEETIDKMRKAHLGKFWVHNSVTRERIFLSKDSQIPEGFVRGFKFTKPLCAKCKAEV